MLPALIILILMVAALLSFLSKNVFLSKMLTIVSLAVSAVMSLIMVGAVSGGGTLSLVLGNAPWNLSLSVGPIEAFMSCIFTIIGFMIMWASLTMISHDVKENLIHVFYALIDFLIAMLCGVVFSNNVVNIFIFIEFSSFAAAGIVIVKNQPENVRAGLKYLSLSILGSGLVLMGFAIFYSLTGALEMEAMHARLGSVFASSQVPILWAMIFITVGVSFKSALFPLHIWLPDAHGTAPSPSSAVLSALVLKAYIIFYIKMLYVAVGSANIAASPALSTLRFVVLCFGVLAMLCGSIMAILQTDIKRMIAYSSVAQIGYIFTGIGLGTQLGLYAAIFHILAHAVTKSGLFLEAGSIIEQTHERRLDKMGGIGYKMPITMGLFTIGGLSMVGIPLFVGFTSKWNFATAIMDSGYFWVMIALAISSLLNALYYLPVVIRAFFGPDARAAQEEGKSVERPLSALLPMIVLACFVVLIALFSDPVRAIIESWVSTVW